MPALRLSWWSPDESSSAAVNVRSTSTSESVLSTCREVVHNSVLGHRSALRKGRYHRCSAGTEVLALGLDVDLPLFSQLRGGNLDQGGLGMSRKPLTLVKKRGSARMVSKSVTSYCTAFMPTPMRIAGATGVEPVASCVRGRRSN